MSESKVLILPPTDGKEKSYADQRSCMLLVFGALLMIETFGIAFLFDTVLSCEIKKGPVPDFLICFFSGLVSGWRDCLLALFLCAPVFLIHYILPILVMISPISFHFKLLF